MTVQYRDRSSLRLLFYWFGSVWYNLWHLYLIFLACYLAINLSYRYAMTEEQQNAFANVVDNCTSNYSKVIPITFLLGFYVSSIVRRWWEQWACLVWPDKTVTYCCTFLPDTDHRSTMVRRTIARYCCLMTVLVWKEMSVKVHKRFPTDRHVVEVGLLLKKNLMIEAGLMTEAEYELYSSTSHAKYQRWFVPVNWAVNVLNQCLKDKIISERGHQKIVDEIYVLRDSCHRLSMYDWVQIPLVYTQVVTMATYGYVCFLLVARQTLIENDAAFDYIAALLFTSLEFLFYVGWLKVGEELRCPFGEDEEDFDMNYIVDRNLHVALAIADELHRQRPGVVTDSFYRLSDPVLPHTKASAKMKIPNPHWSLYKFKLKASDQVVLTRQQETLMERDEDALEELLEDGQDDKQALGMTSINVSVEKV